MNFGGGRDSDRERFVEDSQKAEALGFTHAWFFDTQMITADCFVSMTAAAMKTSRIRLGTGVLVPSNRIAAVTANAFATLNGLAPGRIDFGVGTGFSARRAMGLGAMSSPKWRNTSESSTRSWPAKRWKRQSRASAARYGFLTRTSGCST